MKPCDGKVCGDTGEGVLVCHAFLIKLMIEFNGWIGSIVRRDL